MTPAEELLEEIRQILFDKKLSVEVRYLFAAHALSMNWDEDIALALTGWSRSKMESVEREIDDLSKGDDALRNLLQFPTKGKPD